MSRPANGRCPEAKMAVSKALSTLRGTGSSNPSSSAGESVSPMNCGAGIATETGVATTRPAELTHVLPKGLHRIRHYGLFANGNRAANPARARELLAVPSRPKPAETSATAAADEPRAMPRPCRCCGDRMIIIETFARGCQPNHHPAPAAAAAASRAGESRPNCGVRSGAPTDRKQLSSGRETPDLTVTGGPRVQQKSFVPTLVDRWIRWRRNRTVNWMSLRPYKRTWSQAYDFHPERCNATTNRSAARGHTNSAHSTNLEFHRRYLSDIRGRDGFMASPSIRPSALNTPTGKCGGVPPTPPFT